MKRIAILVAAVVMMAAQAAWADGMIVPVRPELRVRGSWAVKYHHVDITVRDQVASVSIDQQFVNTGNGMIEVEYLFPVPPDAAIDHMTLVVNDKEFEAQLLKADEARKIYEDIVRTKKDPALLEYAGFGMYRTKAFPLEAGKPARIVVSYKYACRKDGAAIEVWYPLNTEKFSAKPIEDVEVNIDIKTDAEIASVYSPSHEVKWSHKDRDTRHVTARWEAKNTTPAEDIQVFFRLADKDVGATFLTHQPYGEKDGYFLLMVSPSPRNTRKVIPKDIVIALDRSGSMGGKKIQQAKAAVEFILKNLNAEDRFNLVLYNDEVETMFASLAAADKKGIDDALARLDRLEASGGTNIYDALQASLKAAAGAAARPAEETADKAAPARPRYILFLTDGLPTVGKVEEKTILGDTAAANKAGARIFALGVGYDVNVRLLDKLVEDNHGKCDYVKDKEAVEPKMTALYNKVRNPVMTSLSLDIAGLRLRDKYPRDMGDLFEGDQILLAGRYDAGDGAKLPPGEGGARRATLVIKGMYEGKEQTFEYPVNVNPSGKNTRYAFVEKIWAMRRIGFLLDQMQLHGETQEIKDEIIRLSRDYGILTPYTSFLADERTKLSSSTDIHGKFGRRVEEAKQADTGVAGQMDADTRSQLRSAGEASGGAAAQAAPASRPGESESVNIVGKSKKDNYEAEKSETAGGVRQVGNQAIYQRGKLWIAANASHLDPEKDAEKIKMIERFSDEYFALAKGNTAAENQMLATQRDNEEMLITLRGQAYRIK